MRGETDEKKYSINTTSNPNVMGSIPKECKN